MKTTIAALFPTPGEAEAAVRSLQEARFPASDLSVLTHIALVNAAPSDVTTAPGHETALGAASGVVGGALGATLATLGLAAVPGIGWLLATGPIASALAAGTFGAVAGGLSGGLAGTLQSADIDELDAHIYHEAVRRGGTVVVIAVTPALRSKATTVLLQHCPVAIDQVAQEWRTQGWDPTHVEIRPYDGTGLEAEQARFQAHRWSPNLRSGADRHVLDRNDGGPGTVIQRKVDGDGYSRT